MRTQIRARTYMRKCACVCVCVCVTHVRSHASLPFTFTRERIEKRQADRASSLRSALFIPFRKYAPAQKVERIATNFSVQGCAAG